MELSWLSQNIGSAFITEFVDGDPDAFQVSTGLATPADDTYCVRVLDGRLPAVIPDTTANSQARDLRSTREKRMGAYVGAPVVLPTGDVYGMLCCVSRGADQTLRPRDGDSVRNFADMLADAIVAYQLRHSDEDEFRLRCEAMLAAGGLRIATQPIVDLADQRTVAVEALARFPDGAYSTEDWFHEARRAGCHVELELDAIKAALRHLPAMPVGQRLALNGSADLITSPEFVALIEGQPVERLIVEVTEHNLAPSLDEFLRRLKLLQSQGVLIAIDDAGTGYSSLQQILQVAPDIIKLDRALVSDVDNDPMKQALASAFVTFTTAAKTMLIAEGVETQSELRTLRDLGVPFAQGYLLARPRLIDDAGSAGPNDPVGAPDYG